MVKKVPAIYCIRTATLVQYPSIEEALEAAETLTTDRYKWVAGFFVFYDKNQQPLDESLVD